MEIRKASFKDIDEIMQIYDHAKVFMRENGNKDQWEDGYPGRKLIEGRTGQNLSVCRKWQNRLCILLCSRRG